MLRQKEEERRKIDHVRLMLQSYSVQQSERVLLTDMQLLVVHSMTGPDPRGPMSITARNQENYSFHWPILSAIRSRVVAFQTSTVSDPIVLFRSVLARKKIDERIRQLRCSGEKEGRKTIEERSENPLNYAFYFNRPGLTKGYGCFLRGV